MKFISTKYLLEEGKDAPDETVVKVCNVCNRKFAIPVSEVSEEDMYCEDCKDSVAKMIAENNISEMKNNNSDQNDTINAALGK